MAPDPRLRQQEGNQQRPAEPVPDRRSEQVLHLVRRCHAQGYDAASAKRVYIKLERDQFYALFGDYNTGLSVTELSRYNRSLTGFKSELKTDHFDYTVFMADTNQAYVRDEIEGDGTSGLYHLSRKNIVLNSETITIETRDRFHSEVIVSTQQLSSYVDYTIDYDAGTLFFKSPVYSRDGDLNPMFIVAQYESFDNSDTTYNYGGRGAAADPGQQCRDRRHTYSRGQVGGSGNLEGVDTKVKISDTDTVRAEVASTKTDQSGATKEGTAYLAEIQHRSETVDGKAYVREQANGLRPGPAERQRDGHAEVRGGPQLPDQQAPDHRRRGVPAEQSCHRRGPEHGRGPDQLRTGQVRSDGRPAPGG